MQIAAYPSSAAASNFIDVVAATTSGSTPGSLTGSWGAGGTPTISNVTTSGPYTIFRATTPTSAGTYELSITGASKTAITGPITITSEMSDFSTGIYGPATPYYGQQQGIQDDAGRFVLGSYFARGLTGPLSANLTGTDADLFTLTEANQSGDIPQAGYVLQDAAGAFNNSFPMAGQPTTFSVNVNITDGITTLTKAVTIQNPNLPTICAGNSLILDTWASNPINFFGGVTVAQLSTAYTISATDYTFTPDTGGLFASPTGSGIIQIDPANIKSANFGHYTVTVQAGEGGPAQTIDLYIGHESPPILSWAPNGKIYTTSQGTDGFGLNPIGQILASSDSGTTPFVYTNNPSGLLSTYNLSTYNIPVGATFISASPTSGNLLGTCQATAQSGLTTSLVLKLPVFAGTLLASSSISGTPDGTLTNYLTTANPLTPSGSPKTVLSFTVSGFTNAINWSLAGVTVPADPTCQTTQSTTVPGNNTPRYAITGSGTSGTVTAWNLSAQTDVINVVLTDGLGTYCVTPFNITAAWHTGPAVSIGPGGTFATANALMAAMWADPDTYAGAVVTILDGIAGYGDWSYTLSGDSHAGWWPGPVHLKGDPSLPSQVVLDFQETSSPFYYVAPGGTGQGGIMVGIGFDSIVENLEVRHVSNSPGTNEANAGAIYKNGTLTGNVTVNNCYIHDSDNGYINSANGCHIVITNCLLARCGSYGGHSHNCYCGEGASLTFTNNYSIDSWLGHEVKSRAMVTTIENNFILEGLNGEASVPIDICQGGVVTISNNVIMKTADTSPSNNNRVNNGGIINWNSEMNSTDKLPWPVNSLTASGNQILCMLAPGAVYAAIGFVGYRPDVDPYRNLPITSDITNTQFFNLDSSQWSEGVFGGVAPTLGSGNSVLSTFPLTDPFFINPYTGAAPVNLPNPAMYSGSNENLSTMGSAPGTYHVVLNCPTGTTAGNNINGGLLAAYDDMNNALTSCTWSFLAGTGVNNSSFSLTPVGNSVQLKAATTLSAGYYNVQIEVMGTGAEGSQTQFQFFAIIVG